MRPILELGRYRSAGDDVSADLRALRTRLTVESASLKDAETTLAAAQSSVEDALANKMACDEAANDRLMAKFEAREVELAQLRGEANRYASLKKTQAVKLEELATKLQEQQEFEAHASAHLDMAQANIDRLRVSAGKLRATSAVFDNYITEVFDRALPGEIGSCPLCRHTLEQAETNQLSARLHIDIKRQNDEAKKIEAELHKEEEAIRKFRFENREKMSGVKLEAEIQSAQRLLNTYDTEWRRLITKVQEISSSEIDMESNDEADQAAAFLQKAADFRTRAQDKVNGLRVQVYALENEVKALEVWTSGFKEVQDQITNDVIPEMNDIAEEACAEMAGGMEVQFSSTKTNKKGDVKDEFNVTARIDGKAPSRKTMSGAQGRKADLIVFSCIGRLHGLRQGLRYRFLALDEAFDVCDSKTKALVAEYLLRLGQTMCVLVISHSEELKSYFESRFVVSNDGVQSKLDVLGRAA